MILISPKIETRKLPMRPTKSKVSLKAKESLPETESSAKAIFQQMPLTGSHELNHTKCQKIKLNIIPPSSPVDNPQVAFHRFDTPQWVIASQVKSGSIDKKQMEPLTVEKATEKMPRFMENNEFSFGSDELEKTVPENVAGFDKIESSLQKIQETDHESFASHDLQIKSRHDNFEVQHQSAYALNQNCSDEKKKCLENIELKQFCKSSISQRSEQFSANGSSNRKIANMRDLEQLQQSQLEKMSEYGLRPIEENRLKKIQEFERKEFKSISETKSKQNQFQAKGKNLIYKKNKDRKCSEVVEIADYCGKEAFQHFQNRKSKSKARKSLSSRKDSLKILGNLKMKKTKRD